MGSSMYMSTTNCTSAPCTQYGHAGMRSAGTRSKDPRLAHSKGTHGARRGRMHAHGACLPCRVRPVRTLGAAAMPPPTGAARRRAGKRRNQPARLRRPTQARRTACRRQARQPPPSAPAPGHRTAPPHRPRWVRPRRRRGSAAPPNAHAADHQARHHGAGRPTHARVRPRPPLPPPTHCAPMCPIFAPSHGPRKCAGVHPFFFFLMRC